MIRTLRIVLATAVAVLLVCGGALVWRAESKEDKGVVPASRKPVAAATAKSASFQPSRTYVGTLEPWLDARIGPQIVSAYIDTVLVRPGAVARRGEVLATLDCRDTSAGSQAVSMQARAIDARREALASESSRIQSLLAGKFVSANEAEQRAAESDAVAAELRSMKAKLTHQSLAVDDCVLRAPFAGEIATRSMDPGAFVVPGMSIVSIVDRGTVRFTTDVPEIDFSVVAPGTRVRIVVDATGQEIAGTISRRSPAADPSTRTVHFEADLPSPDHQMPVGTTADATLDIGGPEPATEIPLEAAAVRGKKATVFVIEGDLVHARAVDVKGAAGDRLFVDTSLAPGTLLVTEGRALLNDGDRVSVKEAGPS
jgi:membrane fusion protein, multidrug efflux system